MRLALIYVVIFGLGISAVFLSAFQSIRPDEKLVGKWKEVSWEYEKWDEPTRNRQANNKIISDEMKELIGQNLMIHQSETWEFMPDGKLILTKKDGKGFSQLNWKLKGRGHILQLKTDSTDREAYKIRIINARKLEIHLELDVQARGIAKLTFEKTL